jgi:hypothetical protein
LTSPAARLEKSKRQAMHPTLLGRRSRNNKFVQWQRL